MSDKPLNVVEVRILGSLIEKELTTPEYYPLTLNALTNACNQKNNREPVVAFKDTTVVRALDTLREKKLVSTITGAGIRVPKYKHNATETFNLSRQESAALCLLFLRGPQTVGEVRGRTGPMFHFESLQDVQTTLDGLIANQHRQSLVVPLPRQTGQKEIRYMHLLSGTPESNEPDQTARPEAARLQVLADNERITLLEEEVKKMKEMIGLLQEQLSEFRKQFE
ncbi:MAG: YceH family protein [Ignavibacteria bacterium]|nr:YceH family protein [Ignavibacteria bacterium]